MLELKNIKFRGKRTDVDKWTKGGITVPLLEPQDDVQKEYRIVSENNGSFYRVHQNSIGRLTGHRIWNEENPEYCTDEVYEGDIVATMPLWEYEEFQMSNRDGKKVPKLKNYVIGYEGAELVYFEMNKSGKLEKVEQYDDGSHETYSVSQTDYDRVVGNFFENPELVHGYKK